MHRFLRPFFALALACLLILIGIKVAHGFSVRFDCLCAADAVKYFICCQLFAFALCSLPAQSALPALVFPAFLICFAYRISSCFHSFFFSGSSLLCVCDKPFNKVAQFEACHNLFTIFLRPRTGRRSHQDHVCGGGAISTHLARMWWWSRRAPCWHCFCPRPAAKRSRILRPKAACGAYAACST